MMQVRWASVVVLAAVAWGAPSVETIELKVGQRVTLPIRPTVQVSLSDDAVVQASAQDDQTLALQGRVAGNSVLTVRDSQGKHTYLVRVAAVEPAAPAPVATRGAAPGRTLAGLEVRTQVDKVRVVPDDVVTYTVLCHNHGPAAESQVTVRATVGGGLEWLPVGVASGRFDPTTRQVTWQVPVLAVDEHSAFSFQARVADVAPGTRLETVAAVHSATMPKPREGQPAATEVVSSPLVAAFAIPDTVLSQNTGHKALIDIDTAPGQRLVERLEGLGVVKGFPDGTFRTNATVTRAEATKMIVSVRQLVGLRDKSSITVALARGATVKVQIDNRRNVVVRQLADNLQLPQGQHQVIWDGLDDAGKPVPMGVYRYQVTAVDETGATQTLDGTIHVVSVRPLPKDLQTSFRDVPPAAWFHPYVAKAEQDGLVKGYPGRLFEPNAPIRRVENTVLVVRAAGLSAEAEKRMNEQLGYSDSDDIPKWAVGYVAVATTNGHSAEGKLLIGYTDNRFLPQQNLTRGEAATILERLLDREEQTQVEASGRIARGHSLAINGKAVAVNSGGRFRQEIPVKSELELVPVQAR